MDIKFSKDSAGGQQAAGDSKGKQNVLLVVLLVLVGVFAYIYFFTGLIKPMPEQKVAEAPAAPSQVVKQPLPSPDGAAPTAGTGEVKPDAAAPAVTPAPAPAAAPAAAPAPVAAAKPVVQEAAKAKEEPKIPEGSQTAVKKPLPGADKSAAKKTVPVEKKQPAVAENKPQPPKVSEKKPVDVKKPAEVKKAVEVKKPAEVKKAVEVKKPVEVKKAVEVKKPVATAPAVAAVKKALPKPASKTAAAPDKVADSGNWTVLVGNYVLEEAMATDLARVRKAGAEAFIVPGAPKKTHMNRLLLAEFTDRASAQAELARLKRVTTDAFAVDSAGMRVVYAGSYLLESRAASEKERLAADGFNLTVKRVDVSIPTKNLTAGSFADKSAAEGVLNKLRAAGVKATLSRQ